MTCRNGIRSTTCGLLLIIGVTAVLAPAAIARAVEHAAAVRAAATEDSAETPAPESGDVLLLRHQFDLWDRANPNPVPSGVVRPTEGALTAPWEIPRYLPAWTVDSRRCSAHPDLVLLEAHRPHGPPIHPF